MYSNPLLELFGYVIALGTPAAWLVATIITIRFRRVSTSMPVLTIGLGMLLGASLPSLLIVLKAVTISAEGLWTGGLFQVARILGISGIVLVVIGLAMVLGDVRTQLESLREIINSGDGPDGDYHFPID